MTGIASISEGLSKVDLPDKAQKEKKDLEQDKQDFLKFFIESLKGQDPTSPMDHSQMTNAMLSFKNTSSLMDIKGILYDNLNKTGSTKLSEASSHLGQDVIIEGNDLELVSFNENGKEIARAEIMYQLAEKADGVLVLIKDEHGKVISELQSSKGDKGKNTFEWNGEIIKGGVDQKTAAKLGQYTYEVKAVNSKNEPIKVQTFSSIANTIDQISLDNANNILLGVGSKSITQDQIHGYKSINQDKISTYGINKEAIKSKFLEKVI